MIPTGEAANASVATGPITFEDTSAASQIRFRHVSGMSPQRYQPEADGSGVAVIDFDGDGWQDLFFATSIPFPLDPKRAEPHHVLYRSRRDKSFEDVTESAGLKFGSFGQGLAVGDIDNDGFSDVYLTNYGPNFLFRNNGDGTFALAEGQASSPADKWGTGCGFLDYDEDGDLDLYVANYAKWTVATHPFCGYEPRGIRTYCHPGAFQPDHHVLWRNEGNGTFTDQTRTAGIYREDGRGFGVVACDVNQDRHIDLFIANDMTGNFLFLGKGDGRFEDVSSASGAALSGDGQARACMGVDAADLNGDGLPELFVTNFWMEPNTLYHNLGRAQFMDASDPSGLGSPSRLAMGWGTGLVDFDNDGWADVFVSNGHIDNNLSERLMDVPYRQRAQLWRNLGGMRFELISDRAGPYFSESHVGRAAAFGDIDNDGRLDLVCNNLDAPARLLRNSGAHSNHWIRLELVGVQGNRTSVGARVEVRAGQTRIVRELKGGTGYLSAHDQRLLIGTGTLTRVERVTVRWPSGAHTELSDVACDKTYRLRDAP